MELSQTTFVNYFDKLLNSAQFEDYGPNGLQVDGKKSIKRVAFAVSATQDSLQQAIDWGADTLVVHHGIFWKHQGARTVTGAWGERVKLCVKNDLNLIAYHLPLDSHMEVGNASSLATEIGLTNLAPFALHKRQYSGCKGEFASPIRAQDLKMKLAKILAHEIILASPNEDAPIKTMGIITGGANNDWVEAMKDGLDAYLTGEISEYNWHDSIEAGIHYFAGGHHATERVGIQSLMKRVKKDFAGLEVKFFDSSNPA